MHFLSCGAKSYCGKVRLRTLKLLPVSTEDNRKKKKERKLQHCIPKGMDRLLLSLIAKKRRVGYYPLIFQPNH
jgi:hypothetical protein